MNPPSQSLHNIKAYCDQQSYPAQSAGQPVTIVFLSYRSQSQVALALQILNHPCLLSDGLRITYA